MEKSIITFSANEQNLQKTGGIGCYASDTVSYIEAHFDLGENWNGYDSIRAVWFNDYKTISTVLDSDGVCIVPHEVLTSRGKVMVNLVGSVLVSDELSDRLTTFPCEALKVSAKAKISGSETAAVTPSQFEQFVSIVISEVEKVTGMTAQAETLPAGSQATARYENGILYLGIPQGIQGERGETGADGADGNGIASVVYNADYSLTLIFDNGERFTTPPIRGERGPAGQDGRDGTNGRDGADGVTPSLSVGTVTTLPSTEDAYVTRTGTDENPVFNFGIPQGPKGDTGEVTMSQLSALLPTDTASGDIVSIPDGQSVIPAESLKVALEPIQDLHGYDKPWVGGAGKNKANIYGVSALGITTPSSARSISNTYGTNIDSVDYDGEIVVTQTAFDDSISPQNFRNGYFCVGVLGLIPNQAYKFCADIAITDNHFGTNRIDVFANGTTASPSYVSNNKLIANFTYVASGERQYIEIRNAGMSFKMTNIMVILDTESDTSYAPYSNICPISGHTECVTEVCGKNLWDDSIAPTDIEAYSISGNKGTYKGRNLHLPNGTYTFSYNGTTNYYIYGNVVNADGSWVSTFRLTIPLSQTPTFTLSDGQYAKLYMASGSESDMTSGKIQLEVGSTATAYEPYQGNTYTTTLGRTVYGGTLDVVSGELVVDRVKKTFDGTETWAAYDSQNGFLCGVDDMKMGRAQNGICDKFATISGVWDYGVMFGADSWVIFFCHITDHIPSITNLADWKAWLADNPTTVVYPLATPQTYQLDPQTISLLHGNNNVWSEGSVEVTYNADVGLYIDKKLGTSGTRTLSMTRTLDTKSEETKTDAELTKSDNIQLAED